MTLVLERPIERPILGPASPLLLAAWRFDLLAVAVLVACTLATHGSGLRLGFWLDDNNHLELCREHGFASLLRGNTFDWNQKICRVWWASQETGWAYFRPVTVAIRAALLATFGLDPVPFHAVHLGLITLSVVLLYALMRRCGTGPITASLAGLFFVLHPIQTLTANWLAGDCSVLVGLWSLLAALLFESSSRAGHRRPVVLASVLVLYALAMLSRENGIMLGPMLILFDRLYTRRAPASSRRRLAVYALLGVVAVAYLAARTALLEKAPPPRSPYFQWPSEPGFLGWLPYKLLYDAVCLPLGLPFVPVVNVSWLQARPVTTAIAALTVVGLAYFILYPLRRSPAAWGVVAATLLALAPTALVFSAAYNFYPAAAGWAVLLALWAQRLWPVRPRLVGITVAGLGASYVVGQWAGAASVEAAAYTERMARQAAMSVLDEGGPEVKRLFIIDLPFLAVEVGPAVRLESGRTDLEVYPLTFSPQLFSPYTAEYVEMEDERTLLIRARGDGWFAGPFGRDIQLSWFGATPDVLKPGPLETPLAAGTLPFRVEIVEADERGVKVLQFIFDDPLNDPRNRFCQQTTEGVQVIEFFGRNFTRTRPTPATTFCSHHGSEAAETASRIWDVRRAQMTYDRVMGFFLRCP